MLHNINIIINAEYSLTFVVSNEWALQISSQQLILKRREIFSLLL